jgi:hypothetical protein
MNNHNVPKVSCPGYDKRCGEVVRRTTDSLQLSDPSLLKLDVNFVNGEWVKAKSGKTFDVYGK